MATLILNHGRCSHARCVFCGYGRIRGYEPTPENLRKCFDEFFDGLKEDEVKVYGSGSFFDDKQVPPESVNYFRDLAKEKGVKRIQLESRPEYVSEEVLEKFRGFELTVSFGLESADEKLLKKLEKGYGRVEYEKAAKLVHDKGHKVKTYLLVNPPYAQDVKKELDESVNYALKHSDQIVAINTLPHGSTPLMSLWISGQWSFLDREGFMNATCRWRNHPMVELEFETFRFVPNFPANLRQDLKGVGEKYLTHPHMECWHDYIVRWYQPPKGRSLLFLPCAYRKPYNQSKTHKAIIGVLGPNRRRYHEVMLSNAGVIPREFEDRYPFNAYDWDERLETPEIKKRYIEVTKERIINYLEKNLNNYDKIACYLKYDSESYKALEQACSDLGIGFTNLLTRDTYEKIKDDKSPLQTEAALTDLKSAASKC